MERGAWTSSPHLPIADQPKHTKNNLSMTLAGSRGLQAPTP